MGARRRPRGGGGAAAAAAAAPSLGSLPLVALLVVAMCRSVSCREMLCQNITVPMCRGIGYNHTYMPNDFNHDSQDEAGLEVHQFWPLVEIKCSPDLRFFLCSMYTPICLEDYKQPLPPCRSVCERARAGCAPLMRQYGFAWPDRMRCDRLPVLGDQNRLCMDYNKSDTTPQPPEVKPTAPVRSFNPSKNRATTRVGGGGGGGGSGEACESGCACRAPMVAIGSDRHPLYNRVRTGSVLNCAMPCHDPYFTQDERTFASFWIGLWSILCFVSTFTTVVTFLIDMERFKYPERPIIFLSACYAFVSMGYIVRLVVGHDGVICNQEHRHVHYETTGPALCTVVFLLTYFFGMASSIWWVILSLTWFMAAGMKWSSEAIAGYSQYYHLAAWLLPSVQSVAVLATSSVDADPLAGICSVGAQSLENLRGFVLVPLTVYLCVGAVFLLAGFTSLVRIRNAIKQQGGTKTDKLEKLMVRIGIFSMLYTVPAIAVVACYFYEERSRDGWARALICPSCQGDEEPGSQQQQQRPDYGIFMLKYFMCLVVGITSGVWIWSGKTVDTWKRLCCRCCGLGGKSSGAAVYSEVHGGSGGGGGGGGGHHHHHHHHHHLGTASGGPGTAAGAARAASSVASSVSCHKPAPLSLV
ncbi:frizzled-8-like [Petromyzon marinus]|uniref:frizzled-8-like n=1 Tax=Petromyzon marinus TaxID=7757 RepID=UPI003F6FE1FD